MAIDITPSALLEFAKTIKGNAGSAGNARVATVTRIDKDGVVYVSLPGGVDETPLATSGALLGVGDTVYVTMSGGKLRAVNNYSEPSIGARSVDSHVRSITTAMQVDIENAKTVADEAAAVAAATNQHFWDDSNGAHVTDVTHDEWLAAVDDSFSDLSDSKQYSNALLNSLGILLRSALNNLVSITRSAVAFYDGLGNAASNIVAQFGSSGARIGKVGGNYAVVDEDSFDIYHGQEEITHIGYGLGAGASGNVYAPFYTLGTRSSGTVGAYSTVEGLGCSASNYVSHAEGNGTTASGVYSHAEGFNTKASGQAAHAEGSSVDSNSPIIASGIGSHAEGQAQSSHSITASGNGAHAEGTALYGNILASGDGSHAEGSQTQATALAAHAEGANTTASGSYSHAEGNTTTASGDYSHAEGYNSTASGNYSHAEGYNTTASGKYARTGGYQTTAGYDYQTVIGKFNENKSTSVFEIGYGSSAASPDNVFEVDTSGNVTAKAAVSGTNGTFAGSVSGASVSVTGAVSGASGTFTGALSGSSLTLASHSTAVGSQLSTSISSAQTVSNNSTTALGSISLPTGTWLLMAHVQFSNNTTGYREISLSTTSGSIGETYDHMSFAKAQAPSGGNAVLNCHDAVVNSSSSNATYYLNAWQNSGSSLTATGKILATRLV